MNCHGWKKKVIARIAISDAVTRIHISNLYKMKCNVVCNALPTRKIYDILPPPISDLENVLAIIFISPNAPIPDDFKKTPLLVRRDKVAAALEWLKLNHSDYADLQISYKNLQEYPEDRPPVAVDFHPTTHNSNLESTAVHDNDDEHGTSNGMASFVVHGLTSERVTELWDTDPKQIYFKALRYFEKGNKALGVGTDSKPESLWNNPQLYPSMFPWLFPYGTGGLGNSEIHINVSDAVRKKNWLMYYDKRFQTDQFFSLIAFNQQQITCGEQGQQVADTIPEVF